MKFIETYIEFDGSDIFIYKRDKTDVDYLPFWKRPFYRYYWVAANQESEFDMEGSGNAITKRQAKNDALSILLDKEWEHLPRNVREKNVRHSNYS